MLKGPMPGGPTQWGARRLGRSAFEMNIDELLLIVALAAYITGTIVFIGYFLSRSSLMRSIGIPLAAIGCAAQFGELGARWVISGIWPLTNLYGSLSLFSAMGVLIFIAIALGYATTWNEAYMPPVPALQSYWIKIHVPLVISSYASFMVAFVVGVLYL